MVKAGGADRLQRRHAKIDNVDDSLEYRGKDGRAPRGSDHHHNFITFQQDCR